jgi:hypothetical protein
MSKGNTPKVGDEMNYVTRKKVRGGYELASKVGVVKEIRTVKQALVLAKGARNPTWVDLEDQE